MGTEQKKIREQLSELQGKVKDIHGNQEKLLKASKTAGEASETGNGEEASKKAEDEAEAESSAVRNAELWVKDLKNKVGHTVYDTVTL